MTARKAGEVALRATGLAKSYGPIVALQDVDFDCSYGRIAGLVGDNGAGKSTLVKVMVGVERPDRGQIMLDGTAQRWRSPADARAAGIETVFQDLALCEDLSVWRNFFLQREVRRGKLPLMPMNGTFMRAEATEALREFGLRLRSFNVPVQHLSGGERQGLAIARAVHFGARVLIMDEPTNALSVYETEKVLEAMTAAVQAGLAVIVISHTLAYVHDLADEVFIMQHGRCASRVSRGQLSLTELEDIVAGRRSAGDLP